MGVGIDQDQIQVDRDLFWFYMECYAGNLAAVTRKVRENPTVLFRHAQIGSVSLRAQRGTVLWSRIRPTPTPEFRVGRKQRRLDRRKSHSFL